MRAPCAPPRSPRSPTAPFVLPRRWRSRLRSARAAPRPKRATHSRQQPHRPPPRPRWRRSPGRTSSRTPTWCGSTTPVRRGRRASPGTRRCARSRPRSTCPIADGPPAPHRVRARLSRRAGQVHAAVQRVGRGRATSVVAPEFPLTAHARGAVRSPGRLREPAGRHELRARSRARVAARRQDRRGPHRRGRSLARRRHDLRPRVQPVLHRQAHQVGRDLRQLAVPVQAAVRQEHHPGAHHAHRHGPRAARTRSAQQSFADERVAQVLHDVLRRAPSRALRGRAVAARRHRDQGEHRLLGPHAARRHRRARAHPARRQRRRRREDRSRASPSARR